MREWKIAPLIPFSALGTSVYVYKKKNTPGWGSNMDNNGDTDFYYPSARNDIVTQRHLFPSFEVRPRTWSCPFVGWLDVLLGRSGKGFHFFYLYSLKPYHIRFQ